MLHLYPWLRTERRPAPAFLLLLLLSLLGALPAARAQVADYVFSQQNNATWTPLVNPTIIADASGGFQIGLVARPPFTGRQRWRLPNGTIPFPFVFNGHAYTGLWMSQYGYVTFGPNPPHMAEEVRLPSGRNYDVHHPLSATIGTDYEGVIAVLGGLIGPRNQIALGPAGYVQYKTIGTAPNRTFVMEWLRFLTDGDGWPDELNFQIRLHETTNQVELAYGPTQVGVNFRVEVGLRGFTTTDFINRASGSFTSGSWVASAPGTTPAASMPLSSIVHPVSGLTYTYSPPVPPACAKPFSLVVDSITGTTVQLHWRVSGGTGPYAVRYGVRGFNPTTGGTLVPNVPDTTLRVTGLLPFTRYQFYVTQTCGGAAGNSARSLAGEFTTTLLNDDPRGAFALPVTATCQPLRTSNVNAITSPENGYQNYGRFAHDPGNDNCGSNFTPSDVWFTFTTAATGPASRAVTITIQDTATAIGAAGILRVFASDHGWHGPFRQIDCARGPTQQNGTVRPLVVANLTPSTTYYIWVAEYDQVAGTGPFRICVTDPPACSDPLHLEVPFDSLTATSAMLTFLPGASNASYTVTVTPAGGTPYVVTPAPTTAPIVVSGLTPATDYSVSQQANCPSGGPGTIKSFTFTTRPLNDDAPDAIALPLTATCQPVAGTNHGAHSTYGGPCAWRENVWYKVRTAVSGPGSTGLRIRVSDGLGRIASLQSAPNGNPAGPFTVLRCVESALYPGGPTGAAVPPIDATGLTPNTTYFVSVATSLFAVPPVLPFTVCATPLPTCLEPTTLTITATTTTTATVTVVPPTTGAGVELTAAPAAGFPGPTVTLTGTASPFTLTGLAPGTPYVLTARTRCGAGFSEPLIRYFNTKVTNDEPLGAIALPVTVTCQPTAATTVTATRSSVNITPAQTCGASFVEDVWFTFTTPATGVASHDVRIVATGAAHEVSVFRLTPGNPATYVRLACSAAPRTGPVTAAPPIDLTGLTPATTYYLSVTSFGLGDFDPGPFTICVTEPQNPCGEPSNLAATAITSTGATLTFSGGLNALGYTATYRPLAGGTPQTQSGTASPLPLTGLTPATTYLATVVSNCAGSRASSADSVVFTTAERCAAVLGLTAANLTPTTADLTFTAIGPAASYAVAYGPVGGPVTTITPPPAASPVALAGLAVGTTYTAYVVGQCPSGETSDTVRVTFTTPLPPCPAITGVSTAAVTATTAEVSFTPSATATEYEVTVVSVTGGTPQTQRGPASPVVLTGLTPATAYAATVAALCPITQTSPASLPTVFVTQPLGLADAADAGGLRVWPNPAAATVQIAGAARQQALTLLDARGRVVRTATASPTGEATFDLRGLAPGLYLVRTGTAARRLMVGAE